MNKYVFDNSIKNKIKALCQYNNYSGVIALLLDYLVIVSAILIAEQYPFCYPLAVLLIGSRQRALATILHEAAHKTLAANRDLNKILGTYFSGYLIFQTWDAYTNSHVLNHHSKLGDHHFDPDYQYYIQSGVFLDKTKYSFIIDHFVNPILCINILQTIRYLIKNRLLKNTNTREILKMFFTTVIFASLGSYVFGAKFFILYWLIPYVTSFQVITWFIELAEHYPLIQFAKTDLYASRNRFSNSVETFFMSMHNENFHLIHHLFPGIPFWNLRKAHLVLLADTEYARINASFGGIFLSCNYVPSKWQIIFNRERNV